MSFRRLNYFDGQILTAKDFAAEQNFCLDKHRRHNRYLHGWGVVWGLKVSITKNVVTVDPGFALDCFGNELELEAATTLNVPRAGAKSLYVVVRYKESATDPVPTPGEPSGPEDTKMAYSRILETVEGFVDEADLLAAHQCPPGQKTCGKAHPVLLARIKQRGGVWALDRRFVVPRCN